MRKRQRPTVVAARVGVRPKALGIASGGRRALVAALLLAYGRGGVAAQAPEPAPPAEGRTAIPASTRVRFIERYGLAEDETRPEVLGPYRVAARESIKTSVDSPQGTPRRNETTIQSIVSERPAQVGAGGSVTSVVRRYDAFRVSPAPPMSPSAPKLLEGLTLWYRPRVGREPLILCLTEGARLRDVEYNVVARQVFLPELTSALPALPSRVGEHWKLPQTSEQALLGERPVRGGRLTATFEGVTPGAPGAPWVATIGVAGRSLLQAGDTLVNARIQFSFTPPAGAEPGTIDARGAITGLRMSLATTVGQLAPDDRLRRTQTRELVLQRQRGLEGPSLDLPAAPPAETEENSWLTYDDPRGRFHFRHPQDFRPAPRGGQAGEDSIDLVQFRPEGLGVVTVQMQERGADPAADRQNLDPETHRARLNAEWAAQRLDVKRGPVGWLPEAEWAPSSWKVYRIEAQLKPIGKEAAGERPRRFDYYLMLSGRAESLVVTAMTDQDPTLGFRDQVEAILKTCRPGPSTVR